ncbi:MAG: hypothetical protein Q9M22_00715 [Mariprofundaceae bacterium]|nr:hypothetical protein [Mariprofundaceae bacterium]
MKDAAKHKKNYKHFSMLRKAIVLKHSGVIRFHTADNYKGQLFVYRGGIDCSNKYQELIKFLSSAMLITEWHDGGLKIDTIPAIKAISHATNHLDWPDTELHAVSVMFSKLPQVRVTLLDIHFDSFLTDISYNLFYQQSLSIEGFTPAYFLLNNDSSNALLLHRVRILTFNYVLGMMNAIKIKDKENIGTPMKRKTHLGFIKRIINRIRGL